MNGEPKFKRDEETGQSRAVIRDETPEEAEARKDEAVKAEKLRKGTRALINGVEVTISEPERKPEPKSEAGAE